MSAALIFNMTHPQLYLVKGVFLVFILCLTEFILSFAFLFNKEIYSLCKNTFIQIYPDKHFAKQRQAQDAHHDHASTFTGALFL